MMSAISKDAFYNGQIIVYQHRHGYRFSIDAVILAHHAHPPEDAAVLDLGTGCGIIPLLIAHQHPTADIMGVEIQPELADIASRNIDINQMRDRIRIVRKDMREIIGLMPSNSFDLVVCNPPYRKANSGRINPNSQKAVARHEITITLSEIIDTASHMLKLAGKLMIIYTADRLVDVIHQMRSSKLEPKWMRMVHSTIESDAKMVLVEAVKGGRPGIKTNRPLVLYQSDGVYTEEVAGMIRGHSES